MINGAAGSPATFVHRCVQYGQGVQIGFRAIGFEFGHSLGIQGFRSMDLDIWIWIIGFQLSSDELSHFGLFNYWIASYWFLEDGLTGSELGLGFDFGLGLEWVIELGQMWMGLYPIRVGIAGWVRVKVRVIVFNGES